jgi:uncharacterized protein YjbI with pentapeptide repeats
VDEIAGLEALLSSDRHEGVVFAGLDARGVDLSRKELEGCTFRNARLPESRWTGAVLEDCAFEGCDLSNMVAKGLALRDVRFVECKLLGVDFAALAPSPRLSFDACDLRYAAFAKMHLRRTSFVRSRLEEATFDDVDLSESDFAEAALEGAIFKDCTLRKADFSQARAALLDPAKNRVKDAKISLEGAVLLATSLGLKVSGFDAGERPSRKR